MNQNELVRLVNEMISAPSCCKELQEAGRNWLSATDPEMKKAATAALLQEIREDVPPIEDVIAFFESPQGIQAFGPERAQAIASHAREVKARGGKWCDCPACAAGRKILESASLSAPRVRP